MTIVFLYIAGWIFITTAFVAFARWIFRTAESHAGHASFEDHFIPECADVAAAEAELGVVR